MNKLHPVMVFEGIKRSVVTYTRLPLKMTWDDEKPHTASVAFLPFIGLLIALLSSWPLFVPIFDVSLMALFMLLTAVLLTGAFHEDGFMDSLDGLVGGIDQEQRLSIMKDSRLGSYASMGIWFLLSMKWLLLTKLITLFDSAYTVAVFWCGAHILARIIPIIIMHRLPYVSIGKSKAQGMITRLTLSEWGVVFIPAIGVSAMLNVFGFDWVVSLASYLCVALLSWLLALYFKRKIQGVNGDVLGASEQVGECALLLLFVLCFSSLG